jgi:phosphoribosylaminoimidazole (AIR) synthetase
VEAAGKAIAAEPQHGLATLGEVLLTPTTIYAGALRRARTTLQGAGADVRGLAHVTGGGLATNVPRAVPDDLAVRLDPSTWRVPSVIRLVAALAGQDEVEMRATFNAGIGMVVVVGNDRVSAAKGALRAEGLEPVIIGEVVARDRADGSRYVEGPIEAAR